MLRGIQQFFASRIQPAVSRAGQGQVAALQLATTALLLEVTRADHHFSHDERRAVVDAVQRFFKLSPVETDELIKLAEREVEDATDLYQFTRLVNDHFDYEQKLGVMEMLWRMAFADGNKDKYEEYLIRRLADLLYVSHKDFIRLRQIVEAENSAL